MSEALKRARRMQTLAELDRLAADLDTWQQARRDADTLDGTYRGQYDSQLKAIVGEVTVAVEAVREKLSVSIDALPTPQVYARLSRHDRQIIWIRRAWDFFRAKFDQRSDSSLRGALSAADEVLWSCYKPFFQRSGVTRPPAPLPYIEFDYLPSAVLASQGHQIDRLAEGDEGPLAGYFDSLPVPVLRLPPAVVSAPWALALIAHEVGHFLMPLLDRESPYLPTFRAALADAVTRAGGGDEDRKNWSRWAPEIFADWFAVLAVGSWAVWAIAQYELTEEARMRTPKTFYPSPAIRLFLLAEIARVHGLAPPDAIDGVPADEQTLDHRIATEVAAATLLKIPGFDQPLSELVAFRKADFEDPAGGAGFIRRWSTALLDGRKETPKRDVRSARLLAAATAQAWKEMSETSAEPQQLARMNNIRANAFPWIVASGELDTRAAVKPPPLGPSGKSLKDRLLDATDDDLFLGARGAN